MANNLQILILAAGKGTRMNSDTPKVLHEVSGIPMIEHVIDKAKLLKPSKISIMINKDLSGIQKEYPNVQTMIQEPQLGTGHAVQIFLKKNKLKNSKLLVLYGDNPLVNSVDLKNMNNELKKNDLVIMGFDQDKNSSYGIIIEKKGRQKKLLNVKKMMQVNQHG